MYKLLFDSDALIKVTKADILDKIVNTFKVFITEEVYNESVKEGKKGLYQDADKIENFVNNGKIKILKGISYKKNIKPDQSFGKGETSSFQAYKQNYLIATDDLSFTSYLHKRNIRTLSSAHLLIGLVRKNKLKKDEAYYCLDKLKPYIREEIYELVKSDIGGKQNDTSTTIKDRRRYT